MLILTLLALVSTANAFCQYHASLVGRKSDWYSSSSLPHLSSSRSRTFLAMHGGHDHSHSHHIEEPITFKSVIAPPQNKVILVAALSLLASTIMKRRVSRLQVTVFCFAASTLSLFSGAKEFVKNSLTKLRLFRGAVLRHSSPITPNYFFKNENGVYSIYTHYIHYTHYMHYTHYIQRQIELRYWVSLSISYCPS